MFKKLGKIPTLSKIPFEFVVLLLQAFLLVSAPLLVQPGEVMSYRFLIMTYMVLLIGMKTYAGQGIFKTSGTGRGFLWFTVGLLGGSIVLTGWGFVTNLGTFQFARGAPLILLLTQSIVVAYSEEAVFRNYAPAVIGVVPAQFAFMAYHSAAYSLAVGPMIIALIAGFCFYATARLTNSIWTSVGLHCAYNLVMLGVI